MISRDAAENKVIVPYGSQQVSNNYLFHAEDSYPLLKAVDEKKIPYFMDAYSILANTMERFYKGVCVELQKLHPEVKVWKSNIERDHAIADYAMCVNRFLPISPSKEGYYHIIESLRDIQKGYTAARYYNVYEYRDFTVDFGRYDRQRKRIGRMLDAEITKARAAEVAKLSDTEEDAIRDDMDDWGLE